MNFQEISYQRHANKSHDKKKLVTWMKTGTVDAWRHDRMYSALRPLINSFPSAHWLTVGDGRLGTDANFLEKNGISVTASDISEVNLKKAKEAGFITKYDVQNAEKLSYEEHSFDFVLCKEAYHHFPRPMVALYEMLRVARHAVILIEPNDHTISDPRFRFKSSLKRLWQSLKNEIKLLSGKPIYYSHGRYEPDGNYVFTISEREIEKVALGLNLPAVGFKGMDDVYIDGVEEEMLSEGGPLFRQISTAIKKSEAQSATGYKNYGLLVAVIFKSEPTRELIDAMTQQGFRIDLLPRNPYVPG